MNIFLRLNDQTHETHGATGPQCYHGVQCSTRKDKKEGVNHGRLFYACLKGKDDACGYFE